MLGPREVSFRGILEWTRAAVGQNEWLKGNRGKREPEAVFTFIF